MSDIFISYSSKDIERIQPYVQAFEKMGWSVWWDREIPIGKTFDAVIEDAIDAANCVIVLWSENSVKSDWVRIEASEGKKRDILVPVLIDNVKIPLAFRLIEAARLQDWDGVSNHPELEVLLEAVRNLIGKSVSVEENDTDRKFTRKDVLEIIETCRIKGEQPEFRNKNLTGIDLNGSDLKGVDFTKADLSFADLEQANLENTNFQRAILDNANLYRAHMKNANLRRASLNKANLFKPTLTNADLSEVDLRTTKVNFDDAQLDYAKLLETDLSNLDLTRTILTGAEYSPGTRWPVDFDLEKAGAVLK